MIWPSGKDQFVRILSQRTRLSIVSHPWDNEPMTILDGSANKLSARITYTCVSWLPVSVILCQSLGVSIGLQGGTVSVPG